MIDGWKHHMSKADFSGLLTGREKTDADGL
jgi:hypothetical protein